MEKGREQWWVAEPTHSQEHRTAVEALTFLFSDAILSQNSEATCLSPTVVEPVLMVAQSSRC